VRRRSSTRCRSTRPARPTTSPTSTPTCTRTSSLATRATRQRTGPPLTRPTTASSR
jgi:hypothetical protein